MNITQGLIREKYTLTVSLWDYPEKLKFVRFFDGKNHHKIYSKAEHWAADLMGSEMNGHVEKWELVWDREWSN